MKATITQIKRFAVHDGDGIRTTVFLKGCPLECVWCHNPEAISYRPELAFHEDKCVGCMACTRVCPTGAHIQEEGAHRLERSLCSACGQCVPVCAKEALTLWGREMSVEELMPLLLEDREFYLDSGGGVTLSGGECLTKPQFCRELLRCLKAEGIHTAVDTCGFVDWSAFEAVLEYTDLFLYDVKAVDREVHMRCTGQGNESILDNLRRLDAQGKRIEIRIPYVPGWNDSQMEPIRELLAGMKHISRVKVLPYHNYAGSKYVSLGMENTLPNLCPSPEAVARAQALFG